MILLKASLLAHELCTLLGFSVAYPRTSTTHTSFLARELCTLLGFSVVYPRASAAHTVQHFQVSGNPYSTLRSFSFSFHLYKRTCSTWWDDLEGSTLLQVPDVFKVLSLLESPEMDGTLSHWQSCRDRFSCVPLEIPHDWPGYPACVYFIYLCTWKTIPRAFSVMYNGRFLWEKRQIRGRQKTAVSGLPMAQWPTTMISKCVVKKWEQERNGGVHVLWKETWLNWKHHSSEEQAVNGQEEAQPTGETTGM